jgi:hypothetical protein
MRKSNSSRGYHHNHYVPEWYQKKFLQSGQSKYWYLDLKPEVCTSGKATWTRNELLHWGPVSCFAQDDLYTVKWGNIESTDVERFFFGQIDNEGKDAVEYFASFTHPSVDGEAYRNLLRYMSVQRLRTPKGLKLLEQTYRTRSQNLTLLLLQRIQNIYSAIWTESVWQIADASQSSIKFIVSDHPVTVYNRECPPMSDYCKGVKDPDIRLVGTHTFFPLSSDKVLIFTNLSWVRDPYQRATAIRPNPKFFRRAIFNFTDIQTDRVLTEEEVLEINLIIKKRAFRFVAAAEKDWLYPERHLTCDHWRKLGNGYLLMPDPRHVHMGGEVYIGYKNGGSEAFGPYGHRPWQRGYKDPSRENRESRSLERFKAEWAAMHGPKYRGISFHLAGPSHPPQRSDSDEMHEHYLKRDMEQRRHAGERQRRRRLVRR